LIVTDYVQKICKSGNSAHITLNRHVLRTLQVRPGDHVQVLIDDMGVVTVRSWDIPERRGAMSPGRIAPAPGAPSR
jgi:antitoxin component of MazEF toxin-antitoxin module